MDNGDTIINADVLFGEWVASLSDKKDIGMLNKFKTVQIESEPNSSFRLYVLDTNRGTMRTVDEKYTIGRKPYIGGDAKNIKIGIMNNTDKGFRINAYSYEGEANIRSRRV